MTINPELADVLKDCTYDVNYALGTGVRFGAPAGIGGKLAELLGLDNPVIPTLVGDTHLYRLDARQALQLGDAMREAGHEIYGADQLPDLKAQKAALDKHETHGAAEGFKR